jgi:predicted permease
MLRLAPRHFRQGYQAEITTAFGHLLEAERREKGAGFMMTLWFRGVVDLLTAVAREWRVSLSGPWQRPFRHLGGDVRGAVRAWRRAPGFSITIVLTLVFGIGLASAIFAFANGYLFRPLPFRNAEQLYYVRATDRSIEWLRGTEIAALRQSGLAHLGFATSGSAIVPLGVIQIDGREVQVIPGGLSVGFGDVLGLPLAAGRLFTPDDHRSAEPVPVLLAHRLWAREFGSDPAVLGRELTIHTGSRATQVVVVGVTDPRVTTFDANFGFFNALPELFAPEPVGEQPARNLGTYPIVRLPPEMTVAQAQSAIGAVLQTLEPAPPGQTRTVALDSVRQVQVSAGRPMAVAFFTGSLLALGLVAINLVLLLLTRASRRTTELATRAALGASRWRIARLFLVESLAYGVVGIGGGLVIGHWMAAAIAAELPTRGNDAANLALVAMTFDSPVLVFALAMGLLVALFGGVWPAWKATRVPLSAAARTYAGTGSTLSTRFSKGVLTAEVALSTVVLIGTAFAGIGIWRYVNQPVGFDLEDRYLIRLPIRPGAVEGPADWPAVLAALRRSPGVSAAAMNRPEDVVRGTLRTADRELDKDLVVARAVGPELLEARGVDLLAGRTMTTNEIASSAPLVVVDEKFARYAWPERDPIGMTLRAGDDLLRTVVGVVSHQRVRLSDESPGLAYVPQPRPEERGSIVVWAPGLTTAELTRRVEGLLTGLAPAYRPNVFEMSFDRVFADELAEVRLQRPILLVLGLFAFAVAGVGLFGLVAYLIEQRTRDFGIRLALGADAGDIWREVVWHGTAPAMAGVAIGVASAWALQRIAAASMFGWDSSGPLAATAVSLSMLVVAVLAAVGPARRVLRIDPTVALRSE